MSTSANRKSLLACSACCVSTREKRTYLLCLFFSKKQIVSRRIKPTLKLSCAMMPLIAASIFMLVVGSNCLHVATRSAPNDGRLAESNGTHHELVRVLESGRWLGFSRAPELAPESQVVGVYFDLDDTRPHRTSVEQVAARSNDKTTFTNNTKQSQEFEIHQGGAPVSASTSQPVSQLTDTSATTAPPSSSGTSNAGTSATIGTSARPTEPPTPASDGVDGPLVSSTLAPGSTPTSTPPVSPAVSEPAPVGSKTERAGDAVLCGEANANGKSNKRLVSDRIVGGHKTEPGEFPFQVRLNIRSRRGSGICGGVVLDKQHILTAAHCMTACVSQHLTTVTIESAGVKATIGDHSIRSEDGEQELEVDTITPHEKYDACNFYANDHDIALIKTATNIEYKFTTDGYGSINRPCMPEQADLNYAEGEQVIVSGWGVTRENSGALSNILRYVQVPIVNTTRCQETYGARVTKDHVCAGFQVGGKDSCQGDSGGPLVRVVENRYELVGIVSFGYGCGQPGAPGVYTRVASYIDWIKANI